MTLREELAARFAILVMEAQTRHSPLTISEETTKVAVELADELMQKLAVEVKPGGFGAAQFEREADAKLFNAAVLLRDAIREEKDVTEAWSFFQFTAKGGSR